MSSLAPPPIEPDFETFVDYAGRQAFDNYDEYLALYGAPQPIEELPLPRITTARMVGRRAA